MNKVKISYSILFFSILLFFQSCEGDLSFNQESSIDNNYEMSGKLEFDSTELVRNSVLEMTEMFKLISQENSLAYKEVFELLKSDFYIEPYIGLFELLEPQKAVIYEFTKMDENLKGSFKKVFEEELNNNPHKYPNLKEVSKRKRDYNSQEKSPLKSIDLNFHDYASIAFYVPYILNDNDIEFELNDKITLVPAVIDSDSGLGYKKGTNNSWSSVMTDDDYAVNNFTLIIEPNNYISSCNEMQSASSLFDKPCIDDVIGDNPDDGGPTGNQYTGNCSKLEPLAEGGYIRQVFMGHVRLTKQYDRWISFTNNGGGSEIRIGRLDSRDQIEIDSIGNISADQWDNILSINISRRNIRKGNYVWAGAIWHKNWECRGEIHEALFGVYEEDNEGDIVFDATIKWKDEELFNIDATIQNRSKDEIIRKMTREKTEFFTTNLLDQGGGTKKGLYSFSDRDWAIYDVGATFSYTMPHRWVLVGNNVGY